MTEQRHVKDQRLTDQEFLDALSMLRVSCREYDSGAMFEAARISTCVHSLLQDQNRRNPSLLSRCSQKFPKMVDTSHPVDPRNLVSTTGLVMLHVGGKALYQPALDNRPNLPRLVSFRHWWEAIVIHRPKPPFSMSRKNLVFMFRNQLGGGHFSKALDDNARELKYGNPGGWKINQNGEEFEPEYGPEYASVRQIGYEVVASLQDLEQTVSARLAS